MRAARCLAGLFCALASLPSLAQTRLRFVDPPLEGRSVSGSLTFRISSDPFQRPQGVRVGISLDGDLLKTFDSLPADFAWDSASVPNGEHYVRLVLVDSRSRTQTGIEELRLLVSNKPKPAVPTHERKALPEPAQPPSRIDQIEPPVARKEAVAKQEALRTVPQVETHEKISEPASKQVLAYVTERPLNVQAITMHASSGNLYVGLPGGGIRIYETEKGIGSTVGAPAGTGETRAITTGGGMVWWLAAPSAGQKGFRVCAYRPTDSSVRTFELAGVNDPKRLGYHRGQVYVFGSTGGAVLDPKTGSVENIERVLPAEDRENWSRAALHLVTGSAGTTLAAIRPSGESRSVVSVWRSHGERWVSAGKQTMSGSVWISGDAATAITKSGVTEVRCGEELGEPSTFSLPELEPINGPDCQAARFGNSVWWARAGRVFHANLQDRTADVFVPWNEKGLSARFLVADEGGAWVATNRGVRRIVLDKPEPGVGYVGYVRMRIGGECSQPSTPQAQRMAELIEEWQGTPYVWGGSTRSGTDCSGFVMAVHGEIGLGLPHGSDSLRSCSDGERVTDELRYGDVLVYPGHCALYIGDGRTAETVSRGVHGVGKSTVWRRTEVVVRRFLDVDAVPRVTARATPRAFASRHMKPGPMKKAKPSGTQSRKGAKRGTKRNR